MPSAEESIPATVRMFSGCQDVQTSADVSNVGSFQLPDPHGRAGGALTSCLLNVTYQDHHNTGSDLSFKETLMSVRDKLKDMGYEQIPQLSCSHATNIESKFTMVPDDFTGKRRAVMIGINYTGDNPGELSGCHNDVHNMKEYIMDCHGFQEEDIVLLLDDGENTRPTAENMMAAFRQLASDAEPGDALFVHYSGHGCSIKDDEREEDDGHDEALCPVDYAEAGVMRDDDIFAMLIAPLPEGCTLTCVMDCCHSGSILDLPYGFLADGKMEEMQLDEEFDYGPMLKMAANFAESGFDGLMNFHKNAGARRKKRRARFLKRVGLM